MSLIIRCIFMLVKGFSFAFKDLIEARFLDGLEMAKGNCVIKTVAVSEINAGLLRAWQSHYGFLMPFRYDAQIAYLSTFATLEMWVMTTDRESTSDARPGK